MLSFAAALRWARPYLAALTIPVLSLTLIAAETAPAPRFVAAEAVKTLSATELDKSIIEQVKSKSELMKNLEYLSDTIGPRLTGSKNLERANEWTAAKMKEYGLENVKLEPWEIPVGWERGPASMIIVDPDTKVKCAIASVGWTPGTKGKLTSEVVVIRGRELKDLEKYKGKLKNAVVMLSSPPKVSPITDLNYGQLTVPKKDAPKKDEPKKAEPKKDAPEEIFSTEGAPEPVVEIPFGDDRSPRFRLPPEVDDFFKTEGVAARLSDSAKPHGLLVAVGGWSGKDRAEQDIMPRLMLSHESYSLLFRLASRPAPAVTKVELDISNKFIPGPITVFNTVGEVKGSEKPDEFVVVGAHLDSWDLATGTMDNGTGSCVVLEAARTVAALAKAGYPPKRTIRFCLFTGEEQGLHGSKQYVIKHKDEMPKTSLAIVHDTGTGKVTGFATHGHQKAIDLLGPELATLATMDGWKGLDLDNLNGSDHQSFQPAGVPGFACHQEIDEYRLTHHTQTDTFDHAKKEFLIQGAQVMAVTAVRAANLPDLLPRAPEPKKNFPKKEEPKKD